MFFFRGSHIEKWGKPANRLDRLAPNLHTYADSSGNEHGLKNNDPLETPGDILRGVCGQKLKPGKCGQTVGLIAGCCLSQ